MKRLLIKFGRFWAKNVVLLVAVIAAAVSAFFIAPSPEYLGYFDYKTLACLFGMMAIIEACKNIYLFRIIAAFFLRKFSTTRKMVLALVYITFVFSMFIANDMALLTFLPFTYLVLRETGNVKLVMYVIIMQNIAANLGGMLTPFGNPQNLYLHSYFNIPNAEFFSIMIWPFLLSVVLIFLCCIFVKDRPIEYRITDFGALNVKRTVLYAALFIMAILMVFNVLNYIIGFIIILLVFLALDRKALKTVDYPLLATFAMFFVFTGNLSQIGTVKDFLGGIASKSTLLVGIASCQIISNVPTAILFSKLIPRSLYPDLLLSVNLGGMGTLVASLASLISFTSFSREYKGKGGMYLGYYSLVNFGMLAVMILVFLW